MGNSDFLIRLNRVASALTVWCCVLAASLFFGCDPSEDTGPTANNPSPTATTPSPTVAITRTNEYAIGDKISFNAGGNSMPYKVSGWSDAETKHSWTNGVVSVIAMRISPSADPVTLKLKCGGFTKDPEVSSQPVEVYANDEKIADWNVRELADYTAPIPPAISKNGGLLNITFKIPKAASPKSLGMSQDPRLLGLTCFEMSLTPTR